MQYNTSTASVPAGRLGSAELVNAIRARRIELFVQPIVNLHTGSVLGVETLLRGAGMLATYSPISIFSAAAEHQMLEPLEHLIRDEAFRLVDELPENWLLFLNNSPSICASDGFAARVSLQLRALAEADPRRIVMEITEWMDEYDCRDIIREIASLQDRGFQVAIDDVGAGINGLNQIMLLRPHWIKLDRALIRDIASDELRQNMIRSLVSFAESSRLGLIAEGVEKRSEMETLIKLGVKHAQGHFIARPEAEIPPISAEAMETIKASAGSNNVTYASIDPSLWMSIPTRVHADEWLAECLNPKARKPAHLAFIDLPNFTPYTLRFGYVAGQRLLNRMIELIQERLVHHSDGVRFWAHLGADQFMLACCPAHRHVLDEIARTLENEIFATLSDDVAASLSFEAPDHRGEMIRYGLPYMRVVDIDISEQGPASLHDVYDAVYRIRKVRTEQALQSARHESSDYRLAG